MRIAIVGAGLMGRWHAFYAKQLGAQVVLVVDADLARARSLAKRHGAVCADSLESALVGQAVDLVHVCTPIDSHLALVSLALEAGKHVIVEKPLAAHMDQVRELLQKAERLGLLLVPVHQFAFQAGVQAAARKLASRSALPLSVCFDFASAGGAGKEPAAQNRILAEILPHPLSILEHLWPAEEDSPATWAVQNPSPGELSVQGIHGQLPVSMQLSMNARPTQCQMTIKHAAGALHLDLFHGFAAGDSARVSRGAKLLAPFVRSSRTLGAASLNLFKRALGRQPAYPGLAALLGACYAAIESSGPAPISAKSILAVAEGCQAIEEQMSL